MDEEQLEHCSSGIALCCILQNNEYYSEKSPITNLAVTPSSQSFQKRKIKQKHLNIEYFNSLQQLLYKNQVLLNINNGFNVHYYKNGTYYNNIIDNP